VTAPAQQEVGLEAAATRRILRRQSTDSRPA